jgi:hypothetical protein
MITVYHLNTPRSIDSKICRDVRFDVGFECNLKTIKALFELRDPNPLAEICYVKVAKVDTNDLDVAFELTNHLHQSWALNHGVTPLAVMPQRSTSVGDVLELSSGKLFVVASFGFLELEGVKR